MTGIPIPETLPAAPAGQYRIISIVLIYAVFGASWILLSDKWMQFAFSDPDQIMLVSLFKGWLFIGLSSLLLYVLMRHGRLNESRPIHIKQLGTPFLAFALLIAAITSATAIDVYRQIRDTDIARLQAAANAHGKHIADWLQERTADAEFIQSSAYISDLYRKSRESEDRQFSQQLTALLEHFSLSHGFNGIALFNAQGEAIWESASNPANLASPVRQAVRHAADTGKPQMVDPFRASPGQMLIALTVPLSSDSAPGIVVLYIDLSKWWESERELKPNHSGAVNSMLFWREGEQIVYLNQVRHGLKADEVLPSGAQIRNLPAVQALRSDAETGAMLKGFDYNNIPVLGVVLAIAGSHWYMQAEIPLTELYGEAMRSMVLIAVTGLLALFICGAVFYLIRQNQQLSLSQAIQQSQAEKLNALSLLSAIADSSNDAIYAKDTQGRYILFNRAASEFTEKPISAVLGQNDHFLFPPEQAESLMTMDRQLIAESRTLTQEELLETPQGSRFFISTKGPLRDAQGLIIGVFGISRDITGQKQTELSLRASELSYRSLFEKLRISEERLKLALDAAKHGLWDWDLRIGLAYLSPGYYEISGYRAENVATDFDFFKKTVHPDDWEKVWEIMSANLAGKIPNSEIDYRMVTASGAIKWIRGRGQVVERDNEGKALRMVGAITDISRDKAAEAAMHRQSEELSQRNAELERFNRAAVGRELDMIELKKQINALSLELGRNPPYPLAFLDNHAKACNETPTQPKQDSPDQIG